VRGGRAYTMFLVHVCYNKYQMSEDRFQDTGAPLCVMLRSPSFIILQAIIIFIFLTTDASVSFATALSTPPPSTPKKQQQQLPDIQAAVIVPGFLTGGDAFRSLAKSLSERGIPTVAVPMPAWHWLPCLGGRSMRPILERVDMTVRHVAAGNIDRIPKMDYNLVDLWKDFWETPGGINKVGGSDKVAEYTIVEPRGRFPLPETAPVGKIALIGHSAGGWIGRIYLSERLYGGKAYKGQELVHTLVTLGSPHLPVVSPAFEGISWVNEEPILPIRQLAVGGTGFKGDEWGALTKSSYAFCCADGSDGTQYDGDGVTPVHSAVAWKGAQQRIVENVTHFCWADVWGSSLIAPELTEDHKNGGHPWYGDDVVLDEWATFLEV